MDMDLKPPSQPQMVNPTPETPPAPAVDPFKPDPPAPAASVMPKKRGGKGKKLGLVLLVLALMAVTGYGVYYWQHQQVDKLAKQTQGLTAYVAVLNAKVDSLNAEKAKTTKAVVVTAPTTDEQVIGAVKAYCQAQVDPTTKKALVFTATLSQPSKKAILYSTDKNFASMTANCGATATTPDSNKVYYLKLSGASWVVLYGGTMANPDMVKLYNIPATFN
jgi:hypothetical protein